MEAVRPSATNSPRPASAGDGAAPPKLSIEKFADGGITCLKFMGTIDEGFDGKKLARSVPCDTLVLDTGGVKKISSFGIREWVDFVSGASKQCKQMILIECAPKVVDQLNMVANFAGGGRVFSFYAPFRCDYCDSEHRVLLDVAKDFETIRTMKLAERPCPSCKEAMYFDDDGSTFFSYVIGQGTFELDRDVVAFLGSKLDYRVGVIDQKVRIDKVIDGRITYLRVGGDLNDSFPRDKLAEGLEGTVIVDVSGVSRVEPAGAAEWRSFVTQVTPLVEQIYLVGVQPQLLERLCGKEDLGAKAEVVDFTLPYVCDSCGTTTQQPINVAEHHSVLKFATAPELRCPQCKAAMQGAASEALMTVLPTLPAPVIAKELGYKIGELRARTIDRKSSAAIAPVARPAGVVARSRLVVVLLVLVLLVVGAIGVLVYQRMRAKQEPGPYNLGPVVQASAKTRPAWITSTTAPGVAGCTREADQGLSCTGVSFALASQAEAEDEASDAAYEALAYEVAGAGRPNAWLASVAPTILETRAAILSAYSRDPLSTQARRDLHDGRHAVARVLAKAAPPPTARYWEAFEPKDGKKFVAFTQLRVAGSDLTTLRTSYQQEAKVLGATVADYYPELGWRYGKLEHGAIVTKLQQGPLQDLGIAEHYVVLAIDGRDVVDADSFAKILGEEYAQLSERGGSLRLLVQADSGDPREFSTAIAGTHVDMPPPPNGHGHDGQGSATSTGGVNIWDRVGGGRGSGRDDPTQ